MNTLLEDIKTQSNWLTQAFREDGLLLDYSINSLQVLDRFFDIHVKNGKAVAGGRLAQNAGLIMFSVGAYLGETMIRNNPGSIWKVNDEDPEGEMLAEVYMPDNSVIWPMERVMKRFVNGPEDGFFVYGMLLTNGGESKQAEPTSPVVPTPVLSAIKQEIPIQFTDDELCRRLEKKPWWKFW